MPFTAKVITTAQWGARDAQESFELTKPMYIVIHNTGDPNPPKARSKGTLAGAKQLAQETQAFHMDDNEWPDSGHNFLNTTDGWLLEGRHGSLEAVLKGLCVRSAHAAQQGDRLARGNESPGIENEGNFMTFVMGKKQWDSLVELCVSLCSSCEIDPANIRGHRDFSNTDCPGDWLYDQIPKLQEEVAKKLGVPLTPSVIKMGAKGKIVVQLQMKLKEKGFDPGVADGIFGDMTRKMVISFQKSLNLTPDGIVGETTRKALGLK